MFWKMLLLAVFCFLTAACGNDGTYVFSDKSDPQSQAKKPTLDLSVSVKGNQAVVTVATDLKLSKEHIDGAKVPGEGHIHAYVDDGEKLVSAEKTITFNDLKPGKHTVKVSLHNNDHTPYDVSKSLDFETK